MALVDVRGFGLDAPGAIQNALGNALIRSRQMTLAAKENVESEQDRQALALQQRAAGLEPSTPITGEEQPLTQQQALARMSIQFPNMFEDVSKSMGLDSDQKKNEAADFAFQLKNTPFDTRQQLINERVNRLRAEGRDPKDTESLLGMNEEQQNQAADVVQMLALSPSERMNAAGGRGAGLKQFAPVTLVNDSTGEKRLVIPTADPRTGAARLEPADMPSGFRIVTETPEEKRQAEIFAAEQKKAQEVTGKGRGERLQDAINNGLDAADGMANLRRADELLGLIDTGGIDAAALRAKQLFGVEGANEAELSNRMSKAVLSQLRATFGAAFTAKEGESLQRIEAGFGKSTEGNRRLIQQTMKIVRRAAERGIRAAEATGDMETAQEIRDALEFRLSPNAGQQKRADEISPDELQNLSDEELRALLEQ